MLIALINKKLKTSLAISLTALALTACGGGGGSDDPEAEDTNNRQVTDQQPDTQNTTLALHWDTNTTQWNNNNWQ